ncbi:hypothetical protein COL8621_03745 [Actibacterium lipolyticum]|uniref:Uncharacterized protein n=1 Tax=Actibacterium lipolyticum TaxID=1524263 RepID=A0A238L7Z7_9RHOB|nr:hypothetical protein COL8621_03745 [Actibacterium lipolyticum]
MMKSGRHECELSGQALDWRQAQHLDSCGSEDVQQIVPEGFDYQLMFATKMLGLSGLGLFQRL